MLGAALALSVGAVSAQAPAVVGVMSGTQGTTPPAALIRCAWPDATVSTPLLFEGDTACGRYRLEAVDETSARLLDRTTGSTHTFELNHETSPRVRRPLDASSAKSPSFAVSVSPDRVQVRVPRTQLGASLLELPAQLAGTVVQPVTITTPAGPRVEGFELRSLPSQGLMADLGLHDGDVLLELNGSRLTGLAMVGGAVQGLLASGHATALVRRGDTHVLFIVDAE